jgi:hypothetical protein
MNNNCSKYHKLKVGFLPCPQILELGWKELIGGNTLAYSGMELFMIVESFIVHPTDFGQAYSLALKY